MGVSWVPVSSGCLGAYKFRWILKGKEKRITSSVIVGSCK
jgi:hypothetical protein